jgi:hypothetical protein
LCGNVGKSHQYGGVDSTCIVKEATNNLLDAFFTSIFKEGAFVGRCGCLIVFSVSDGIGGEGTMLWFVRYGMSITGQLFHDILGHGQINVAFIIIPLEVDATIENTGSIFNNVICFFSEGLVKMVKMFLTHVFDPEVIYCKVEPYWMGFVLTLTGSLWLFKVSVFGKALLEKLVGQDASLWETIHSLANLHVDVTIKCFVKVAVVVDDVLWEKRERHFHVFISVKWHFEIHVLDVSSGKPGTSGADGAVPKEFRGDHVSGMRGEFKRISDKVSTNSDTDAVGIHFLGTMINDNTCIHYHLVGRDTANVFMGEEENGVSSCGDSCFALDKTL